jgi:hypothetical protein
MEKRAGFWPRILDFGPPPPPPSVKAFFSLFFFPCSVSVFVLPDFRSVEIFQHSSLKAIFLFQFFKKEKNRNKLNSDKT